MMNQRFLYLTTVSMTATRREPQEEDTRPMLKGQQAMRDIKGRLADWDAASLSDLRQGHNEQFHNLMAHC
jgi:hypothetical protein